MHEVMLHFVDLIIGFLPPFFRCKAFNAFDKDSTQSRDEWVLRVACDKKAIVAGEGFLQGRQAVLYRLRSVFFVVDTFWARGCSEVLMCSLLGTVSCLVCCSGQQY